MNWLELVDNFHFLRPLWLVALLPLLALVFILKRQHRAQSGWQNVLASHLYQKLVTTAGTGKQLPPLHLLAFGWFVTCVALAGPTWEKLPQPVFQLNHGKVIVLDMSLSMRATDLTPDRLSRAKFKTIDLLQQIDEGEVGLVAYAGDAFVISPLTSDIQNITALVPSLTPEIMPVKGSNPVYAMEEAFALLANAGYQQGDIYWITDGIELPEIASLRQMFASRSYNINILGVGTEQGSPIQLANGEFLKDFSGAVVIPKLEASNLTALATGSQNRYIGIRPDDSDIEFLAAPRLLEQEAQENQEDDNLGDQWKELGPYLLLLLLPFAAYSFRRGVLVLATVVLLPVATPEAQADWWQNLWQRPDQQGMQAFQQEDYGTAAEKFENPMWQGSSEYKNGNFDAAAQAFSQLDTSQSNYNLGNALAKQNQFEPAIEAYERALELDPNNADAAANKALLEELLRQQEQQQQNSQDKQQDQDGESGQQDQGQDQEGQNQDQQDGEQDQENSQQQQQGQQGGEQENQAEQNSGQPQDQNQEQSGQEPGQEQQDAIQQQDADGPEQQNQAQQQAEQGNAEGQEQEAALSQADPAELTEEQKEQLQEMQRLLRKVPDDPAFLLQRKMQLEQQRRKRQSVPSASKKDW